jgi:hypothetical protein
LAQSVSPAPVGATESFLTRIYRANPERRRKSSARWKQLAGVRNRRS